MKWLISFNGWGLGILLSFPVALPYSFINKKVVSVFIKMRLKWKIAVKKGLMLISLHFQQDLFCCFVSFLLKWLGIISLQLIKADFPSEECLGKNAISVWKSLSLREKFILYLLKPGFPTEPRISNLGCILSLLWPKWGFCSSSGILVVCCPELGQNQVWSTQASSERGTRGKKYVIMVISLSKFKS